MKIQIGKVLIALFLYSLTACESTDDASDVAIFISGNLKKNVVSEEVLNIRVDAYTPNDFISEFRIYSKDVERGETPVYSCNPCSKTYSYNLIYEVPALSKNKSDLTLVFEGRDNLGNKNQNVFIMNVTSSTLKETSGLELFNPKSNNNDGYNIAKKEIVRYSTLVLDDMPDCFWVYNDETLLDGNMPMEWRTFEESSRISFARNNTFDYANATGSMLKSTFEASVKQNYISNIKEGDIILIGYNGIGEAVIKILNIRDEEGVYNDKILFNIKY